VVRQEKFIGVVQDDERTIAVAVLDTHRKRIRTKTIAVKATPLKEVFQAGPSGVAAMADLQSLGESIDHILSDDDGVEMLMEFPSVFPFPPDSRKPVPAALLESESIFPKMIMFFTAKTGLLWRFSLSEDRTRVLTTPLSMPDDPEPLSREMLGRGPELRYLRRDIARAYTEFLVGSCRSSEHAAVVAAMIAKNRGLYYYWASFGAVPSSGDVLTYMRRERQTPTAVMAGNEVFGISQNPSTNYEDIDKIPLEYAVATKKFERLGKNDAIKLALLQVCKAWNLRLTCTSMDDPENTWYRPLVDPENAQVSDEYAVYPIGDADFWIVSALRNDSFDDI
jgi:hypothetical protein